MVAVVTPANNGGGGVEIHQVSPAQGNNGGNAKSANPFCRTPGGGGGAYSCRSRWRSRCTNWCRWKKVEQEQQLQFQDQSTTYAGGGGGGNRCGPGRDGRWSRWMEVEAVEEQAGPSPANQGFAGGVDGTANTGGGGGGGSGSVGFQVELILMRRWFRYCYNKI